MLKNKWKNLSETMKIISTIITTTVLIGGLLSSGIVWINKTIGGTIEKIDKAVSAASQVDKNTKAIEEIKATYTPLLMYNELEKFAVTQIDLEIDETMNRVSKNQYIGTRYVSTLKFYYDNFNFLSSKQRSMIEIIMRYYERQEMRTNEIK